MRQIEIVDNYRYVLNTKTDETIYQESRTNPDGRSNTRGSDLYAHKGKNGKIIFYSLRWSMWQGEYSNINVLTKEEAEDFLIEATKSDVWGYPYDDEDEELLKKYNLNIMEEGEVINK